MDRNELEFNAWVLLGNLLHLLLHGHSAQLTDSTIQSRLSSIHGKLSSTPPERIVGEWHMLPSSDRTLIARAGQQIVAANPGDCATVLGLDAAVALATLRALETETA